MYADNTFPEAPPRPAFSFYLAMTILIAGCLMAICYLSMLEAWYGEVGSSMERTIPTAWSNGFHVTLVSSRCPGESVEVETKHWQKLLGRSGIPFQTVQGVPQHFVSGSGVWVLPSARCLSDSARSAIRRWLLGGGGLVATGPLGLADGLNQRVGTAFFREITGADMRPIRTSHSPDYLAVVGQPPLTLGLTPGERWRVEAELKIAASTSEADGYWSDTLLEPFEANRPEDVAGVTHRSSGQGRVVWVAAGPNAVKPRERNSPSWEKLFVNSVQWAGRRPLAAVSTWPEGHRVAAIIAEEIHDLEQVPDALSLARVFQTRQIPATFFVRAPLDRPDPRLNELAKLAEVGVLGTDVKQQREWGDPSKLRDWLGFSLRTPLLGFRIPEGPVDEDTVRNLARSGYSYYLASPSVMSAPSANYFPESRLFPLDARVLVGLPVLSQDDFTVLSRYAGDAYETGLEQELWRDFEKVQRVGGLFVLNHRADLLGSPPAQPVVLRLLQRVRQEGVWLGQAANVARWWQQREQIQVKVAKISQRRIRLVLSNTGTEDVEQVLVVLALPFVPESVRISAAAYALTRVSQYVVVERELLHVTIGRVKPQSTQTWLIDLK